MKIIRAPFTPPVPLSQLRTGSSFSYGGRFYMLTDEFINARHTVVDLETGVLNLFSGSTAVTNLAIEAKVLP